MKSEAGRVVAEDGIEPPTRGFQSGESAEAAWKPSRYRCQQRQCVVATDGVEVSSTLTQNGAGAEEPYSHAYTLQGPVCSLGFRHARGHCHGDIESHFCPRYAAFGNPVVHTSSDASFEITNQTPPEHVFHQRDVVIFSPTRVVRRQNVSRHYGSGHARHQPVRIGANQCSC
jgi:hypothetical protein